MTWSSVAGPWADLRARFRDASAFRSWTIEANAGVIATAGLLLGFAGAGASNRLLLFTTAAATIAGGLSVGGAAWAEESAERDAQLLYAEREQRDLTVDPAAEIEELVTYWESRGLRRATAEDVAKQLTAHDALAAQLGWEYGFDRPMPATFPIWFGVGAAMAYVMGALVPLIITYFAPVAIDAWAVIAAVVVSLTLSSLVAAHTGQLMPKRMLARTLVVGTLTMAISFTFAELML